MQSPPTNLRAKIFALLKPETGLRCLPAFLKSQLFTTIQDWCDDDLAEYWRDRLWLLEHCIEPLVDEQGGQSDAYFASLCRNVHDAVDQPEVIGRIGGRLEFRPPQTVEDAWRDIYLAAELLSVPRQLARHPDFLERGLIRCVALGLLVLRRLTLAVAALEHALGLTAAMCEERERLTRALQPRWSSPPDELLWATDMLAGLAEAWRLCDPPDYDHAVVLLETWLRIPENAYAEAEFLRDALATGPLHRLPDPTVAGRLVGILAAALHRSSNRGPLTAVQLLEAWLDVPPGCYSSYQPLRTALHRPPFPGNPKAAVALLRIWGQALASVPGLGRVAEAGLYAAWLQIPTTAFDDREQLAKAVAQTAWQYQGQGSEWITILGSLADLLAMQSTRGATQAVALLETWLDLPADTYVNPSALLAALERSTLERCTDIYLVNGVINTLAHALGHVEERGSYDAATLLRTWLCLTDRSFDSRETLSAALARGPFAEIKGDARVRVLANLAVQEMMLDPRGDARAGLLLEEALHLPEPFPIGREAVTALLQQLRDTHHVDDISLVRVLTEYGKLAQHAGRAVERRALALLQALIAIPDEALADPTRLRAALQRSPLRSLGDVEHQVTALKEFALLLCASGTHGADQAVALLEAWLELPVHMYDDRTALADHLDRCPLNQLTSNVTQANLIDALARAIQHASNKPPNHAAALREAWLREPMHSFAQAARLKNTPAATKVWFVTSWLESISADDDRIMSVCQAVVRYVRRLHDDSIGLRRRAALAHQLRQAWARIRAIMLRRADAARDSGDAAQAAVLERRALLWAEHFENRIVLERMLLGFEASEVPVAAPNVEPEEWPFWGTLRPADSAFHDGYLPRTTSEQRGVLTSRSDEHKRATQPEGAQRTRIRRPPAAERVLETRLAKPIALSQMTPARTVWLRVLFDGNERLRWWAYRKVHRRADLLHSGQSAAGAFTRLNLTSLSFEIDVERVWAQFLKRGPFPGLGLGTRQTLRAARDMLAEMQRTSDPDPDFKRALITALPELSGLQPMLALLLSDYFLAHTIQVDHEWLARQLRATLEQLEIDWVEPEESYDRESRRRSELDGVSDLWHDALARELDLSELWDRTADRMDWSEVHLVCQVEGPLLDAPLAWLPFGGVPLFRRVASTSTVLSFVLRQTAALLAQQAAQVSRQLLSTLWLSDNDWAQMTGLARLHAGLQRVGRRFGWRVGGLSQHPAASIENLAALFQQRGRDYGVAVVGGHGCRASGGVMMADGAWRGQGAALSGLDLLVLAACAMGRLDQGYGRDVEGLYVQLLARGCRTFVAARWPIADTEAATFLTELFRHYCENLECTRRRHFARARALNQTRNALVDHPDPTVRVTRHLASSFELYGRG
jgi:hypothetical protein